METDLLFIDDEVKLPLMLLPNRCTIVKVNKSDLIIISPTQNFIQYKSKIDAFGKVVAIVEPNMFHHLFTAAAKELYPSATLYGVEGHLTKCSKIPWDKTINAENWPWQKELPVFQVGGMPKVQEHVFYFKKEKTLVVTDLCFNVSNAKGFGARLMLTALGTYNCLGVSRLFAKFASDKKALSVSIKSILELEFDRLVMAHGDILESNQNPKERLTAALAARGV